MKKHSKKFLAVFATILALACALTACAPAAASSGNTDSRASEAPASSKADEKPVTLKYITYGAKPDTGNCDGIWKAVNEILLRDLNCTMEVEYLGSGDAAQMALKYAGNEEFDFAYTAQWFGYSGNALKNAFYELKMDELKQYAPYMVESLPDIAWKQAMVGGKIYMLPNLYWEYGNQVFAIRGDLREKYGLDQLKTLADLDKYMELVAKNESGMEALFVEVIRQLYLSQEQNYATLNATWTYNILQSENPEYFHTAFSDAFVSYAKKIREFYEKGILAPDAISNSTNHQDMFKSGQLAVTSHNTGTISNLAKSVTKEHPEWKVEVVNPWVGHKVALGPFTGNGFAITRTSANPTKAIEVVNHIYESVELQKLLDFGVEGVDYEMKDGKLYPISNVPAEKAKNIGCNWNMNNNRLQKTFVVNENYAGIDEAIADFEKNTVEHPLQAFSFDPTEVETEVANISAVDKEYKSIDFGMIADVESAVAQYRQALKDAGYDKVKAEYDRQIKEFMATYNK